MVIGPVNRLVRQQQADPLARLRAERDAAVRRLHESYSDFLPVDPFRHRFSPDEWAMAGLPWGLGYPADRRQDKNRSPLPFLTEVQWRQHVALARDVLTRNHWGVGFAEHVAGYVGDVRVQFVLAGPSPGPTAAGPVDADGDGTPDAPPAVVLATQAWEEWCRANEWVRGRGMPPRQREGRTRRLRDGNVLLRHFAGAPGEVPRVRFVEPEYLETPAGLAGLGECSHGVQHTPGDAETPLAYWLSPGGGEPPRDVPADRVTFLKGNVDRCVPVGLSDFFPLTDSLERVAGLLENMAVVGKAQAAIAWWEMHQFATGTQVSNQIEAGKEYPHYKVTPYTGVTAVAARQIVPGQVVKTDANRQVMPGPVSTGTQGFLAIEAAVLRGVAFRFGLPDNFVTDNGASFAGALVAGSPLVTVIGERQEEQIGFVEAVAAKVLELCEASGRLPRGISRAVRPVGTAKPVVIADEEKQVRTALAKLDKGLADPYKLMREWGDEPKELLANLASFKEKLAEQGGGPGGEPPGGGGPWVAVHRQGGKTYYRRRPSGGTTPGGGPTPAPPGSAGGDGSSSPADGFGFDLAEGRVWEAGREGLVPKKITRADGVETTVWVRPGDAGHVTGKGEDPAAEPVPAEPRGLAGVLDVYRQAPPGPGREALEIALWNAGVTDPAKPPADVDAPLLARRLAGEWDRLHDEDPAAVAPLEAAMRAAGMKPVGAAGEPVAFDGEAHEGPAGSFPGDRHAVTRPGWRDADGRLLVRARTKPVRESREGGGSGLDPVFRRVHPLREDADDPPPGVVYAALVQALADDDHDAAERLLGLLGGPVAEAAGNRAGLVKKVITNRLGHKQTVWVRAEPAAGSGGDPRAAVRAAVHRLARRHFDTEKGRAEAAAGLPAPVRVSDLRRELAAAGMTDRAAQDEAILDATHRDPEHRDKLRLGELFGAADADAEAGALNLPGGKRDQSYGYVHVRAADVPPPKEPPRDKARRLGAEREKDREPVRAAYLKAKRDPGSLTREEVDHLVGNLHKLTRDELREHARDLREKLGGLKAELVDRLLARVRGEPGNNPSSPLDNSPASGKVPLTPEPGTPPGGGEGKMGKHRIHQWGEHGGVFAIHIPSTTPGFHDPDERTTAVRLTIPGVKGPHWQEPSESVRIPGDAGLIRAISDAAASGDHIAAARAVAGWVEGHRGELEGKIAGAILDRIVALARHAKYQPKDKPIPADQFGKVDRFGNPFRGEVAGGLDPR